MFDPRWGRSHNAAAADRIQRTCRVPDARFTRGQVVVLFTAGVRCDEQPGGSRHSYSAAWLWPVCSLRTRRTHPIGLTASSPGAPCPILSDPRRIAS
jgi:hypothetical protein